MSTSSGTRRRELQPFDSLSSLVPRRIPELPLVARYALAIVAAVAATVARLALDPLWGDKLPLITFFPAIMVSSWFGGFGPGIVTTLISALAADYFWMRPVPSWADILGLLVFSIVGVLIAGLNEGWRRATTITARSEEQLRASLVRERHARSEAERVAEESKAATQRLQIALQAGGMGTWQWTIQTGEVRLSPELEAIHGFPFGGFEGTIEAFQKEIYPADRDRALQAMTETLEERKDHRIDYRIVRNDGAVRWVEGRGQLFTDAEGKPDRMLGVCSDITNRKQADEALRAKEAELELITSRTPLLLTRCGRDLRYAFVNRACADFFGRPAGDIIGRPIREVLGDTAFATIMPYIERVLRGEHVAFEVEVPYAHAGPHFMRALYTPDRNERGEVMGWVATVSDITERKRAEDDLKRTAALLEDAKREAEHANQLKDQFLATVSHELRAPLNAVLGWAEMLRSGMLDDARRQRALETVYVNAKRQAQLIDDLLDVSRIVSGKLHVKRSAVDLRGVIRAALDVIQPSAEAKRIQIGTDIDESIDTIFGDGVRLQQILSNLLTNAVKFTPEAGTVRVSVRRAQEVVEIVVSDTGKGITPDFLPCVFEPFRQADGSTTRAHGGLGLGLAIVKHLVEAHGGTVAAESAGEGRGATFTVRLPLVSVYSEQAETPSRSLPIPVEQPAHPIPSLDGIRVLVVDDDADGRDLVAACLESAGASVFSVASTAAALEVIQRERVDVLLADIAMPGEDGYTLIRKVRALESSTKATIRAAALTSFARQDDKQRALQAGFQLHLGKPIDSRVLIKAVASLAHQIASR